MQWRLAQVPLVSKLYCGVYGLGVPLSALKMANQPKAGQNVKGRSKISYATPDRRDIILTDEMQETLANYASKVIGSQTPDWEQFPDHQLVQQISVDWNTVQRIYAKDREPTQSTYNATVEFDADDKSKPIYTRDYVLTRAQYLTGPAMGSKLTGVIQVRITAAGSGYPDDGTVTISSAGGGGSGATFIPVISGQGTLIAVAITNEGTGYTSAPTLTVNSATGSGATCDAIIQETLAVLVSETKARMEGSPLDGRYILVRRRYQTKPGAIVVSKTARTDETYLWETRQKVDPSTNPSTGDGYVTSEVAGISTTLSEKHDSYIGDGDGNVITDPTATDMVVGQRVCELGRTQIITYRRLVGFDANVLPYNLAYGQARRLPAGQNLASINTGSWELATAYVIRSRYIEIQNSQNRWLEFEVRPLPNTWDEEVEMHFQFPAIFTFEPGLLTGYEGNHPPPFALSDFTEANGFVAYNLTAHRTLSKRGLRRHSYSLGPSTATPNVEFRVVTTASASRVFGSYIGDNTAHPDFSMTDIYVNSGGAIVSQTIEQYQASEIHGRVGKTPDEAYATTDVLVIRDAEEFIDQSLFCERLIDYISEATPISSFPV